MFLRITISFWLQSVISEPYRMASDPDHIAVRTRAHEVRGISMSLLFKKNFAVQEAMRARI